MNSISALVTSPRDQHLQPLMFNSSQCARKYLSSFPGFPLPNNLTATGHTNGCNIHFLFLLVWTLSSFRRRQIQLCILLSLVWTSHSTWHLQKVLSILEYCHLLRTFASVSCTYTPKLKHKKYLEFLGRLIQEVVAFNAAIRYSTWMYNRQVNCDICFMPLQ